MVKKIVTYPNPILALTSQKIDFAKAGSIARLKTLVADMAETINLVKDPPAAGLSAIQIGETARVLIARDFVYDKDTANAVAVKSYLLVNPKYISLSKEQVADWEGCLSFPNQYGKVLRHKKIKIKYQDDQGAEQRLAASGFLARVIQHELDHLDGITFNTKAIGKLIKGEELDTKLKIAD